MQQQPEIVKDEGLKRFFNQVYGYMALGVGITAAVAFLLNTFFQNAVLNVLANHSWVMWVIFAGELVMVLSLSRAALKSKAQTATYFVLYSVLQGLTFTILPWAYDLGAITAAFLTALVVFVTMSIYGRVTSKPLQKMGRVAFMGLIGVLAATVINIFLGSSQMEFILSYATLVVFIILTAWDNQKLTLMYQNATETGSIPVENLAIYGALELYLDFINLFLSILRIFSRNN
ncbi:Bax inhibitor-1/YccA family protein [Lapidilactobacillus luobeiensis]|uniref:Bax inhibitor-1/YccA family protein n=1 Tax=Lapidilactobacillus luobeiensis TaxID=2950371 RepID=UPI0021C40777|nr:Bax inhibitor-1/YccA family protein [Lapidilactobacillus luobeiensis]